LAGKSGRYGHMAGVGNFVLGNLPDLIRQQRDDGEGFAGEGHEFDGAAFTTLVNKHDRADVVLGQAMLRQVGVNTTLSSSSIIVKYPMDTLWLM